MPSYAAFIGHQPAISLAELSAVVPDFQLTSIMDGRVVIFESSAELNTDSLDQLGGTISIARKLDDDVKNTDAIPDLLVRAVQGVKGKVIFSYRTLGVSPKTVGDLYRRTKNALRKQEKPARYVGSNSQPAPSIVLHEEGILDGKHGAEFTVIAGKDNFLWIGRTLAAQDIDAYTHRDMDKPVRDTTVGLLPPKLAQIMLNLGQWLMESNKQEAGSDKQETKTSKKNLPLTANRLPLILDPFCGTGVIPIECLLRGWNVLACDVSQKAVSGCTKNIDWVRKEWHILKRDVTSDIWKQDARKPFKLKELPDMVVTETSLGPNLKKRPMQKEVQQIKKENEELQITFLQNAIKTLPGVPLVVTWPVWYGSKSQTMLEKTPKLLEKIGYDAVLPPGIQPSAEGRTSLIYRRPGQFVGREIVLLVPRKG